MTAPKWLKYGGQVWVPALARTVRIPEKVYAIVDVVDDNLGQGIILGDVDIDGERYDVVADIEEVRDERP